MAGRFFLIGHLQARHIQDCLGSWGNSFHLSVVLHIHHSSPCSLITTQAWLPWQSPVCALSLGYSWGFILSSEKTFHLDDDLRLKLVKSNKKKEIFLLILLLLFISLYLCLSIYHDRLPNWSWHDRGLKVHQCTTESLNNRVWIQWFFLLD